MFEQIAISISTAVFCLCAFIVNGFIPKPAQDAENTAETAVYASADVRSETVSLVGKWSGDGKSVEFTDSGKLICDGVIALYSFDGKNLTVTAEYGGITRQYSVPVGVIDGRSIKVGPTVLHRVGY